MNKKTKLIVLACAAVLVVGVGAGFVVSAGDDDKPLTGSTYDRATEAALEHTGGGTVIETEAGDGGAAYGVEIRKDDGSVVEVELDEDFQVIGEEQDDDGSEGEEEEDDD